MSNLVELTDDDVKSVIRSRYQKTKKQYINWVTTIMMMAMLIVMVGLIIIVVMYPVTQYQVPPLPDGGIITAPYTLNGVELSIINNQDIDKSKTIMDVLFAIAVIAVFFFVVGMVSYQLSENNVTDKLLEVYKKTGSIDF